MQTSFSFIVLVFWIYDTVHNSAEGCGSIESVWETNDSLNSWLRWFGICSTDYANDDLDGYMFIFAIVKVFRETMVNHWLDLQKLIVGEIDLSWVWSVSLPTIRIARNEVKAKFWVCWHVEGYYSVCVWYVWSIAHLCLCCFDRWMEPWFRTGSL